MKKAIAALFLFSVAGCTDPESAVKVLKENGFTNIQMTGYAVFTCGKGDNYHTGFIATSQNGNRVEGAVCSGIFKGSTIRFN